MNFETVSKGEEGTFSRSPGNMQALGAFNNMQKTQNLGFSHLCAQEQLNADIKNQRKQEKDEANSCSSSQQPDASLAKERH